MARPARAVRLVCILAVQAALVAACGSTDPTDIGEPSERPSPLAVAARPARALTTTAPAPVPVEALPARPATTTAPVSAVSGDVATVEEPAPPATPAPADPASAPSTTATVVPTTASTSTASTTTASTTTVVPATTVPATTVPPPTTTGAPAGEVAGPVPSPSPAGSSPVTLFVRSGVPGGGDGSAERPFATIQPALDAAGPGTTIHVGPGVYEGKIATVRSGTDIAPIRLVGEGALVRHDGTSRLFQIFHDHVWVENLAFTGAARLLYIQGATGVRIIGNHLHDAGGECLRLKYQAVGNEIAHNRIERCGRSGFDLGTGSKNGEGVYIGTAPEQLDQNPTAEPDRSRANLVHHNVIAVPAECVDLKEHTTGNVVEANTCTGSRDPNGAGLVSRGVGNIFRGNSSTGHAGAGIQLGGDGEDDGIDSIVTNNVLTNNTGYGLKAVRGPQAHLCGNDLSGNGRAPTTPAGEGADLPC